MKCLFNENHVQLKIATIWDFFSSSIFGSSPTLWGVTENRPLDAASDRSQMWSLRGKTESSPAGAQMLSVGLKAEYVNACLKTNHYSGSNLNGVHPLIKKNAVW